MVEIRELRTSDRAQWQSLWLGYLRFYRIHLSKEVTDNTFARLTDDSTRWRGIVAEKHDQVIGIAHFLFHTSSTCLADVCYLEDLFVDPSERGSGVGRALINAVYDAADRAKAASVYWNTQEFNSDARALYDTLAHRTSFIRYER